MSNIPNNITDIDEEAQLFCCEICGKPNADTELNKQHWNIQYVHAACWAGVWSLNGANNTLGEHRVKVRMSREQAELMGYEVIE